MSDDRDPFERGYDACLEGEPETANPYDVEAQSTEHMSWNDGWTSADNEENDLEDEGE
jgi:ribosome modulation factor